MFLLAAIVICTLLSIISSTPAISVVASVRGKKYDVTAETVEEFSKAVESLTGLEADQQSVLYRGKVLDPTEKFEECGVAAGDVLNVLKGRKSRVNKINPEDGTLSSESESSEFSPSSALSGGLDGLSNQSDAIKKALGNASPEQIQQAMNSVDNLLDSGFIETYFGDEAKLEQARIDMLNNIDKYDDMMPGLKEQAKEIASDPEKWKEAMVAAKEQMLKLKEQRDLLKQQMQKNPNPAPPTDSIIDQSVDDVMEEDESDDNTGSTE